MHCYICDKDMQPDEIQWDARYNAWDPCAECMRVISETFGEEGDDEEVEEPYDDEVFYGELFPLEINEL